jgi:glycosyltransferase involved in cell wall biosynthesis
MESLAPDRPRSITATGPVGPVGLLVKIFPKLSETFILEEILGLEKRGVALRLYTLAAPTDAMTHAQVRSVRAPLTRVPDAAASREFVTRHLRLFATHPLRWAGAFAAALRRGRPGVRDFLRAGWLAEQLRRDGVTHLHTHFISTPADIAALASQLGALPFSISAHAKDIYLSAHDDLKRKLDAAQFTVTCTEFNRRTLASIAPGAAVHRMYHGLDRALFHPRSPAASGAPPLILSVGRLREKKGLDTLIDACAKLRARQQPFACEIIGYGEEREHLQLRIDRLALGNQVRLVGALARDDVIAAYARTAVYVQPSRIAADGDRDGIPNVLLEAMAMGLPVVASRVSGIPELVSHGRNGLLVEPDQAALLADAIERVLTQPALAARLGRDATTSVAEAFDNDRNLELLCGLLGAGGKTSAAAPVIAEQRNSVAYVMNGFPRLSETFIAHEIHQLERLGQPLRLFSVKREREALVHPVVGAIRAPLVYLPEASSLSGTSLVPWLRANLGTFWPAHAALLKRRPVAWLHTAASALALAVQHRPSAFTLRKVFIKEFLQAGWIADAVRRDSAITHLHGHFCHGVTTITWFASRLSALPFSFTAHAKDIYQPELNPGRLLERKLGAARFVATCTCANAAVLRARHPRPDDVHAIYHGLDTEWFSPRRAVAGDDKPLLLAVGRLVEKKGFDQLVAACALLKQRGAHFRCLIVGEDGDAGDALRALIAASNLGDVVRLQGAVAQDALREIYRGAHAFALPCRITADGDRDGFPNVLAEAMAMGVPVVTTPISGIPEMIDNGVHGLLVEGDAASLADAIARLLADTALHARLARAARERICERFDSRRTTLALRDLFLRQRTPSPVALREATA